MKIFNLLMLVMLFASCDPYHFDETVFIELKKDPCFGVCPVYSFKIEGKGIASFTGMRNVEKEGEWSRQLSPDETNAIFSAFQQSKFSEFQDEYTSQVTDLPTTWITYHDGATTKTIKDYYGSPAALKDLEKMVETLAEEDTGWEKKEEPSASPEIRN